MQNTKGHQALAIVTALTPVPLKRRVEDKVPLTEGQLVWCRQWIPGFAKTEAQALAMVKSVEENRKEMEG